MKTQLYTPTYAQPNPSPKKVTYIQLSIELRELLLDIQSSSMNYYGYEELITTTISLNGYTIEDATWLNCVRRKWVNHLIEIKRKQQKSKVDLNILKDAKL